MTYAIEVSAGETTDVARARTLPLRTFAPVGAPEPMPTIVLSHGFGETRDSHAFLARRWAEDGFLVVALQHPGSDRGALDERGRLALREPRNLSWRPADVSFVIDRLPDRADRSRIGVAGHSLGSTTALQTVGMSVGATFADARVRAALAMSPQIGADHWSWDAIERPVMLMTGTADRGFGALASDPGLRRIVYERARSARKYFVNIDGAEHHAFTETDPWYPGGERDPRHHGWIAQVTTAFFRAHLSDEGEALAWLRSDAIVRASGGSVRYEWSA